MIRIVVWRERASLFDALLDRGGLAHSSVMRPEPPSSGAGGNCNGDIPVESSCTCRTGASSTTPSAIALLAAGAAAFATRRRRRG